MKDRKIAGLVVAAGMSSRMKAFKPLLKLGEKTLIEHVIDNLTDGGVQEIVVVTGNQAENIEKQLENRNVKFVRNESYATTAMFQSVKLGLGYLENRCDKFFFLPGDIPLFRSSSLKSMKEAMECSKCSVVQPMYGGKHGHPVLFSANCIPDFLSYNGVNGLKGAMESLSSDNVELALPDKGILMDADTQEDYNALKSFYSNMNIPTLELCFEILKYFKTDLCIVEHCIAVAEFAKELAVKLVCSGHSLNIQLVVAGALLHDVAKKEKEHPVCGAQWLKELGYAQVAEVVESHMNLPENAIAQVDERAVVYLADKLFIGTKRVAIEDRFNRAISRFGEDKQAMLALSIRLHNTMRVLQNIEEKIGSIAIYENSFSL